MHFSGPWKPLIPSEGHIEFKYARLEALNSIFPVVIADLIGSFITCFTRYQSSKGYSDWISICERI